MLWSSDSQGRVYTLGPESSSWALIPFKGVDIKRLSALEEGVWAIGGDHQIYVYVPARDVPIRIQEITYENQRWNPVNGFESRLMPTDRFGWSSKDGLIARNKETIELPTGNWQWEEDWHIQTTKKGQPLELEGWTYAIDFPANYGPECKWNSLVRRRKWVRHRRYTAFDAWAPVPGVDIDPVKEPFIDVSVGGLEIPGTDQEIFCVWAVTVLGNVVFRDGVRYNCPEGTNWMYIKTPCEVHQVSVGPTGVVWAVCWDGNALIRTNVNRTCVQGTDWIVVPSPMESCRLLQISVGWNVVWATSYQGKVWFRKGISQTSFAGNGWVEMVGQMSLVSVAKNDQVFALGRDDNVFYLRVGITAADLTGKTWRALNFPIKHLLLSAMSRTSSSASLHWTSASEGGQSYKSHEQNFPFCGGNFAEQADSSFKIDLLKPLEYSSISILEMKRQNVQKDYEENSHRKRNPSVSSSSSNVSETILDFVSQGPEGSEMTFPKPLCPAIRIPNISTISATPEDQRNSNKDRHLFDISNEAPSFIGNWPEEHVDHHNIREEDEMDSLMESSWVWLTGSACSIDSSSLPHHWYSSSVENISGKFGGSTVMNASWRQSIWAQLQHRSHKEIHKFRHQYPDAIEKSTWTKSGLCQIWLGGILEECSLELQRHPSKPISNTIGAATEPETASLTCRSKKRKLLIDLSEVTCVLNQSSASKPLLGLQLKDKPLLQLAFTSNSELEDWLGTLNASCADLQCFTLLGRISSLWGVTLNGEVYLVDGSNCKLDSLNPSNMFWFLLGGGHLRWVESSISGVVWGLAYNNQAWVYTGGFGGGPYAGLVGRNEGIHQMFDSRSMYIYENQRWNPLSGFTARGLPTDRYMWSDRSGRHHCSKENTRLPSARWTWTSDWEVDFKTPGGVDKEGWQYASDFPRSYHGYKGFTDYVRRRRWLRRCKLISSGPWTVAGTTKLLDISIQIEPSSSPPSFSSSSLAVWAVATNGEALYRAGVNAQRPKGECWIPVATEQALSAISVGTCRCVWAVTKEGSAVYRHGIHPISCPTGEEWCCVEAPEPGVPLRQISVGHNLVLAVDNNDRLWSRQEIVPIFPEGTSWKLVSPKVRNVSVGPQDQIHTVMDAVQTSNGELNGVICLRKGQTLENKIGTSWQTVITGGWQSVSCRGIMPINSN